MNTRRFGWPVIIAAGLHGALFLIAPETSARGDPPPEAPTSVLPDRTDCSIEIEPETDDADASQSAASRCALVPMTVDLPRELRVDEPFTVPVEPDRGSWPGIRNLPLGRGMLSGFEDGIGLGGRGLPDVGRLDRVPRAIVQAAPAYPVSARREGVGGTVWVEFVVAPSGEVVRAEAVRWTRRDFVEPAVRGVLRWRFEPGTIEGRRVSFRMAVPIEFNATH